MRYLERKKMALMSAPRYKLSKKSGYPLILTDCIGRNISELTVYGNSAQGVGDKTENLFDKSKSIVDSIKNETANSYWATKIYDNKSVINMLKPDTTYTVSFDIDVVEVPTGDNLTLFSNNLGLFLYTNVSGYSSIIMYTKTQIEQGKTYHLSKTFTTVSELHDTEANYHILAYANRYIDENNKQYIPKVIFRNIQIEEGETATEYEPYGYEIPVKASGKNLLPYPYTDTTKTTNSITFTDNGDGTITANGTATGEARFVLGNNIAINNIAVISGCPANGSSTTYLIQIVQTENGTDKYYADIGNGQVRTYTTLKTVYIVIKSGTTVSNLVFKPQIEEGTTATPYDPYLEPQTSRIYLDEPLYKIGDDADSVTVNWAQHRACVVRKITSGGTSLLAEPITTDISDSVDWSQVLPTAKGITIVKTGTAVEPSNMEGVYYKGN